MVSMQLRRRQQGHLGVRRRRATPVATRAAVAQPASIRGPARSNLPSRVADNLFWLGRYAERVESGVRLVRALLPALSGEEDFGRARFARNRHPAADRAALSAARGSRQLRSAQQRWQVQRLLSDMVYDPTRASGLGWNLKQMRRVAWHLKERLSADTWRVLQQLEADFSKPAPANPDQRLAAEMSLLDGAIVTLSAFAGLLMENTTRGYGWRFLEIGRRLERALQLAELLRAGVAEAPDEIEPYLQMLLHIADSSITYRTRYLTIAAHRPGAGTAARRRDQSALHRLPVGDAARRTSSSCRSTRTPAGIRSKSGWF